MSQLFKVPDRVKTGSQSPIQTPEQYREHYMRASFNPSDYWLEVTKRKVKWMTEPTLGLVGSYHNIAEEPIAWFSDGTLNLTETCLDQHLDKNGDKTAILWEGDEPDEIRSLTYSQLYKEVCKAANALRDLGLQKGERVIIYMGMVPEAAIAMLACARLGAIHSVVFGGFSSGVVHVFPPFSA